jgi:hypothetical protein
MGVEEYSSMMAKSFREVSIRDNTMDMVYSYCAKK